MLSHLLTGKNSHFTLFLCFFHSIFVWKVRKWNVCIAHSLFWLKKLKNSRIALQVLDWRKLRQCFSSLSNIRLRYHSFSDIWRHVQLQQHHSSMCICILHASRIHYISAVCQSLWALLDLKFHHRTWSGDISRSVCIIFLGIRQVCRCTSLPIDEGFLVGYQVCEMAQGWGVRSGNLQEHLHPMSGCVTKLLMYQPSH